MPIKFSKTQTTVARGTGKKTTVNYYMKNTSLKELIETFNKAQGVKGKGKVRQKISNEFARRRKIGQPTADIGVAPSDSLV